MPLQGHIQEEGNGIQLHQIKCIFPDCQTLGDTVADTRVTISWTPLSLVWYSCLTDDDLTSLCIETA